METGCLHVTANVKNAAMNTEVQISFQDCGLFSLIIYPELGLLDHMVITFLILGGTLCY
jgi:hypothetical protein